MKNNKQKRPRTGSKENFPGYPSYPAKEDIYRTDKEETDLDPEDPSHKKVSQKDQKIHSIGESLDVPGSELDDPQEAIGSEDEENNYYSLGGDDHNDLEEDQDEHPKKES